MIVTLMNLEERKESLLQLKKKYETRLSELNQSVRFSHCDLTTWKRRNLYIERLEAVERALQAIEMGTYGLCVVCNEPIALGRLKKIPFTTKCFECELSKRSETS